MRYRQVAQGLLAVSILAGCSDPTGSGTGRAEGVIQDSPSATPTVTGSLAGDVFVSLSADGTTWVDLGSPNGITIPLQVMGSVTTVHGEQDAPAGSYNRVRLVFDGVTARIGSGSTIGGTTLTSDANLALGGTDQRVEVIVSVPSFTVTTELAFRRTIVFELRSQAWLTAAALEAGLVEDAALQAAVTAGTREDPR